MGASTIARHDIRINLRLKLRQEGQLKRCPQCGRVGLRKYKRKSTGEEVFGNSNGDRFTHQYVKGERFCRTCQMKFKEEL